MYSGILVTECICVFFHAVYHEFFDPIVFHLNKHWVICLFYLILLCYLFASLASMINDQVTALIDGESIVESALHVRVRHYQHNFVSPYQLGFVGNWKRLMGDNPFEWFIPLPKKASFSSPAYVLPPSTAYPKPFYAGIHW